MINEKVKIEEYLEKVAPMFGGSAPTIRTDQTDDDCYIVDVPGFGEVLLWKVSPESVGVFQKRANWHVGVCVQTGGTYEDPPDHDVLENDPAGYVNIQEAVKEIVLLTYRDKLDNLIYHGGDWLL